MGVMAAARRIGLWRDWRSGDASMTDIVPRRLVGTFVATMLLLVVAGPAPKAAAGLALLVGFTSLSLTARTVGLPTVTEVPAGRGTSGVVGRVPATAPRIQ